jgi:hypothetical protein
MLEVEGNSDVTDADGVLDAQQRPAQPHVQVFDDAPAVGHDSTAAQRVPFYALSPVGRPDVHTGVAEQLGLDFRKIPRP